MLLKKRVPLKYIFNTIRGEMLNVIIIGMVVFYLTSFFRNFIPDMPISIPTFLGTAISVILSFKLSQSYERWWEARKIWGSIVNDSRNLVLQLQSYLMAGNDAAIKTITYRQIGWCYCLGQSLRELDALAKLDQFLSPHDIAVVANHRNKPLAILQLNSLHIAELKNEDQLEIFYHAQIQQTQINLTNSMGKAERIKSTVFPSTYRYFLHLTIYLFVITLSISLRNIASYFEIPLLLSLSAAFFLLEKTASFLQDPFNNYVTDTPVTTIATTIETNLRQLLKESSVPAQLKTSGYFVM